MYEIRMRDRMRQKDLKMAWNANDSRTIPPPRLTCMLCYAGVWKRGLSSFTSSAQLIL